MKTKNFDKQILKAVSSDINAALKAVADKYGISISTGRGSYEPRIAVLKLNLSILSEDGEAFTPDSERFDKYAGLVGLKVENRGQEIAVGGKRYKIVGLKTEINGKFPILCLNLDDGHRYGLPIAAVKLALASAGKLPTPV